MGGGGGWGEVGKQVKGLCKNGRSIVLDIAGEICSNHLYESMRCSKKKKKKKKKKKISDVVTIYK